MTGYGVDIGLLLDTYASAGLDVIAQVDLDVRQNAHQPPQQLGLMAYAMLQTVSLRREREGRLRDPLLTTYLAPVDDGPAPRLAQQAGDHLH